MKYNWNLLILCALYMYNCLLFNYMVVTLREELTRISVDVFDNTLNVMLREEARSSILVDVFDNTINIILYIYIYIYTTAIVQLCLVLEPPNGNNDGSNQNTGELLILS